MLVDNKSLASKVLEYLQDVDAFMMGHHEVEFKRFISNLPNHPRLCANVIAQSISESPLASYDIKYLENDVWVQWTPFESNVDFAQLISKRKVDSVFLDKNLASRKANLQAACITWCRRIIFRGVAVDDRIKLVANA
jgi:hypothetical protein